MFPSTNLRMLYKGFYSWLGKPEMLKVKKGSVYEYADVYPLLYLKMQLEGLSSFSKVKHLIVDEMQDYSPVQYKVLTRLFPCKKTILGDINQSVNPFSSSNLDTISEVIPNAECMTMLKSYRSTWEITEFTKRINNNMDVEAIERHGEKPLVEEFEQEEGEVGYLQQTIKAFRSNGHNSLGIICKTQEQADELHRLLSVVDEDINLLDPSSVAFAGGVVITAAHLAKGLEFDQVIVPRANKQNYHTEPDRQMLYVACTRAMHKLNISYTGRLTSFLEENN